MNRPITPDIERAVKLLQPICDELDIKLSADGSVMTIGGQKIGVSCNSTYATVMEAIGFLFYHEYAHGFRAHDISSETNEAVKRYWLPKKQSEWSDEE